MDVAGETVLAEKRIRPHIRETILNRSLYLSGLGGANVYLKLENLQYTGSFKARGAMNKILSLSEGQLARGVVTASTGNHGAAVAYALAKTESAGVVFVTENAPPAKTDAIRQWGAELRFHGNDCVETEAFAREAAERGGMVYVPPYNDPQVIGGQGTIGVELGRQLDRVDAVFVPLGGGGLISGIAGYLKSVTPNVKIIGCSPRNSQVMIQSVKAGRILDLVSLPTLSDGTAGGVESGSMTFEICRELVDDYVTVTEDEIRDAFRAVIYNEHILIEGAAAVGVAAYLKYPEAHAGQSVVIVVSGANVDPGILKEIL